MTIQIRNSASRIVLRIVTRSTSKLKYSYKYLLLFFFEHSIVKISETELA